MRFKVLPVEAAYYGAAGVGHDVDLSGGRIVARYIERVVGDAPAQTEVRPHINALRRYRRYFHFCHLGMLRGAQQ